MRLCLEVNGVPEIDFVVERDRNFGLSVLQRLDGELIRRVELYRRAGARDSAGYRKSDGAVPMPRMLLTIDGAGEFFSEDDRVAQEAGLLLDRLIRQGAALDVHMDIQRKGV